MRTPRSGHVCATIIPAIALAAALTTAPTRAAAAQRLVDAVQVPTDTLRDVAVAGFEHGRPVIYYNPTLMSRVGPQLADFFFAHEYGHLFYGHTGAALTDAIDDLSDLRRHQELAADCYAARALSLTDAVAVEAAVRFFSRMGPFRFDNLHPSGAQRAARILACIPDDTPLAGASTARIIATARFPAQ